MRLVLMVPPYDIIREGYGSSVAIPGGTTPPLGLLSLAAVLRANGHAVRVFDLCASPVPPETLRRGLRDFGAQVLGVSVTSPAVKTAAAFTRSLVRDLALPLVVGGAHPAYFPDAVFSDFPGALAAFRGEAEEALPRFLQAFDRPERWPEIPGVMVPGREGESVCAAVGDLDALPFPAWDLVPLDAYAPLPSVDRHGRCGAVLASRGCPYGRCSFCALGSVNAPPYRRLAPGRVVAEMVRLHADHGVDEFVFWDDNFAVDPTWIGRFCGLVSRDLPGVRWSCTGKVDTVERGMFETMAGAGCFSILFGCETGDPRLLESLRKRITPAQMEDAVRSCRKAGLEVRLSFMLTLPGETPREGRRTVRTAIRLCPDVVNFFPYHPVPGTPLYEDALRKGRWVSGPVPLRGMHEVNYLSHGYAAPAQVLRLARLGYLGVYLHPRNLVRRLNLLTSPQGRRTAWNGLRLLVGLLRGPVRPKRGSAQDDRNAVEMQDQKRQPAQKI